MLRVGVVLSQGEWSQRLHRFVTDHVADMEVVMVRDDRSALLTGCPVVMVDEATPWLTPTFVAASRDADVTLVGVFDQALRAGRERLAVLGIEHALEAAMPVSDMVVLLDRLRPADEVTEMDAEFASLVADLDVPEPVGGQVVVVGGPPGAGAREVAIALAVASETRRTRTLLVDANESSPGVARRLGLAVHPHLLTALERVRQEGFDGLTASLALPAPGQARPPCDVLVGIASVRDWGRLLPVDVEQLVTSAAQRWGRVVVCTSPVVEDLSTWVPRYGVSRHLLASAPAVLAVCEASPRGVLRFCDWVADVKLPRPIHVVLNKAPKSGFHVAELREQLADALGGRLGGLDVVPFDSRVARADWEGTVVRAGPMTKAIGRLVETFDARVAVTR